MPTIAMDCPHCLRDKMTFDVTGWKERQVNAHGDTQLSIACFCRNCCRLAEAVAVFRAHQRDDLGAVVRGLQQGQSDLTKFAGRFTISPPRPTVHAPEHISPEVKRAFLQGEHNRQQRHYDAAGAMFRKALDVATKQKMPESKEMLAKRLRAMKEAGMLTADIADWAEHIKTLGNEATHDADEPTQQDIDDLANLTRMTLIYLFEMPERIKIMRKKNEMDEG